MTVLQPALSDLGEDAATLAGLVRIETHPRPVATPLVLDKLRSVYPHDQIYGEFCPVQGYVDAPPREVFDWLAHTRPLENGATASADSPRPRSRDCGSRRTGWEPTPQSTSARSPRPSR